MLCQFNIYVCEDCINIV